MDGQIEQIKGKIDIIDFIGGYIQLRKAGRNYKALCPFHNEKTPSFVISPDRQRWHCFGACQIGGDIITFLMKWDNVTFYEALKELAEKAGVRLESVAFEDKEWQKKELLLRINTLSADFFEYILHSTSYGEEALEYLQKRGIHPKIMKKFKMGYAPLSWDSLLKFLKKKRFSEGDMHEAGLIVKNDNGHYYDRFRGRIMFPIKDIKGNIIGFSGRMLSGDGAAKYVNTPETPIYHKRESLYGIHLAKEVIKKEGNVFLVEGEFDVITPYQHGFENFVAIKGSAVTREQLGILKRLTNKITLALDGDNAGLEAAKRGIEEAENLEFEIQVITFDEGKDPDEALRKDAIHFKKALQHPKPIYDFLFSLSLAKHPGDDPFAKKSVGDDMVPFISRIGNPIVRSYYVRKITEALKISEESFELLLKKYKNRRTQTPIKRRESTPNPISRDVLLEKYFISYLLQHPKPYEIAKTVFDVVSPADFSIPSHGKICTYFREYFTLHPDMFNLSEFVAYLPKELQSTADELHMFQTSDSESPDENILRLGLEMKRNALKRRIGSLLDQSESDENAAKELSGITVLLKQVEKQLSTL